MATSDSPSAHERWHADLERYHAYTTKRRWFHTLRLISHNSQILSIGMYRFGQYLTHEASKPVRLILWIPYAIASKTVRWALGIHLYPESKIGPGLYIGHYGGIWITPKATLGANCSISQGVVIGVAGGDDKGGPVIGDRVWIGPNAVVTGPIRIGSGAVIAANSLAATNIPENGVAIGVPARVMSYSGSGHLIRVPTEEKE